MGRNNEVNALAKFATRCLIWGAIGILSIIILFGALFSIDAGERGVLLTFGKASETVMQPGLHFKIPIAQSVVKLETRTQKIEAAADSASKDLQDVQTTIALNYHVATDGVIDLYQNIGIGYRERVIAPAIHESVKAVTAQFKAEDLIQKRGEVRTDIKEFLRKRLGKYFIVVDDFNIVNFQFSEEYDKAIEAKVTAEQLKLKADMDLQRIIIEKEQTIARAQAEAESLRLQKQEITPDLVKLREIEVRRAAIEKWNGILPQVTGGGIPLLEVGLGGATE